MKTTLIAAGLAMVAMSANAEPEKYLLDPSHSQVVFSYQHLGFSTNWGMFSGFEGESMFEQEDPGASSVNVSMPVMSMITGWEARSQHFMSPDFFGATDADLVTFSSTGIEVTGESSAKITGDLSMNSHSKLVVLDATLNKSGDHPMAGKPWVGFSATTTVMRSDYGLEKFAPFVSDDVQVMISVEAMKAE